MAQSIAGSPEIEALLDRISGAEEAAGYPRVKHILRRIVSDLFRTIEELDIQPEEFWTAVSYLTEAGQEREYGLIAAGLGLERFLDIRMDAAEQAAGHQGGTPRTIEGPLYVAGAPVADGEARLDDGTDQGETLLMSGRVMGVDGRPVPGAIVEVWHANTRGNYSFFDTSQSPYNLRRGIRTDAEGRYRFRSIMPSGYGVVPGGATDILLRQLGRHGQRPAHIHFFVSAPGYAHLTTQINIADDPLLYDDFAFATRDGLIPEVVRHQDPDTIRTRGLDGPFAEIEFDFVLHTPVPHIPSTLVHRDRAAATAAG